jgi:hypothetical protein
LGREKKVDRMICDEKNIYFCFDGVGVWGGEGECCEGRRS